MRRYLISAAMVFGLAGVALAQTRDLGLVHLGEEATFVDFSGLKTTDGVAAFHILVVAKTGQPVAGGWRQTSVDCQQNEFRTLATTLVNEDGSLGAERFLTGQIFVINAGGPEEAMAAAVCDRIEIKVRAPSILEATKLGRERLNRPE